MCPNSIDHIAIRHPHCSLIGLPLDFTSQEVGEALHAFQEELGEDPLDLHSVRLRLSDENNQTIGSIGLYDLVDFEDEHDGKSRVISEGEWYEVSSGYLAMINRAVSESAVSYERLSLPAARKDEKGNE